MDTKLSKKGMFTGRWQISESFISIQCECSGDGMGTCYGSAEKGGWGMAEKVPVNQEKPPGGGNDA